MDKVIERYGGLVREVKPFSGAARSVKSQTLIQPNEDVSSKQKVSWAVLCVDN